MTTARATLVGYGVATPRRALIYATATAAAGAALSFWLAGGIIGAGLARDPAGVKWKKVGEIAISWVIATPVAALLVAATQWLLV